jgi:type II secretory pathway component PulC
MMVKVSPEEKLLRLIKGEKMQSAAPVEKISIGIAAKAYSLKEKLHLSAKRYLSFFSPQKLILFSFIAVVIYLIILFINPLFEAKITFAELGQGKINEPIIELKQDMKPYEFYLKGIRSRKIFANASSLESKPVSIASADLIKDINLVGIVSGEEPQAIIEDKKSQKTYYLKKSQFIGDFQVEEVLEGRIVLNYNGKKYELSL